MDERREHARGDFTASATILARHNAGVAFSTESISVGGVRLLGPLTLEAGEHVQLLFELEGTPVDLEGVVVRSERHDVINDLVAISFKNLPDAARELIQQLVSRLLGAGDKPV